MHTSMTTIHDSHHNKRNAAFTRTLKNYEQILCSLQDTDCEMHHIIAMWIFLNQIWILNEGYLLNSNAVVISGWWGYDQV